MKELNLSKAKHVLGAGVECEDSGTAEKMDTVPDEMPL